MTGYRLFGLHVSIPFALTSTTPLSEPSPIDVRIVEGQVPARLDSATLHGDYWQAAPGVFLMHGGPTVGRFLVEGSDRVIFQAVAHFDRAKASFLLTHDVMASVLRHRGALVLHATTVATAQGAVAIAGDSGAGKSTTAAALLQVGGRLVADDVTALVPLAGGGLSVLPGIPELHVSESAAVALGYSDAKHRYPHRSKVVIDASDRFAEGSQRLATLCLLRVSDRQDVRIQDMTGLAALDSLLDCVYGPMSVEDIEGSLAIQVEVTRSAVTRVVERPAAGWTALEIVGAINASPPPPWRPPRSMLTSPSASDARAV